MGHVPHSRTRYRRTLRRSAPPLLSQTLMASNPTPPPPPSFGSSSKASWAAPCTSTPIPSSRTALMTSSSATNHVPTATTATTSRRRTASSTLSSVTPRQGGGSIGEGDHPNGSLWKCQGKPQGQFRPVGGHRGPRHLHRDQRGAGSEYCVWQWHGHIVLFDEEGGCYSTEYIYGFYYESKEEDEEGMKVKAGVNSGLKDLIGDSKDLVGNGGGREGASPKLSEFWAIDEVNGRNLLQR